MVRADRLDQFIAVRRTLDDHRQDKKTQIPIIEQPPPAPATRMAPGVILPLVFRAGIIGKMQVSAGHAAEPIVPIYRQSRYIAIYDENLISRDGSVMRGRQTGVPTPSSASFSFTDRLVSR